MLMLSRLLSRSPRQPLVSSRLVFLIAIAVIITVRIFTFLPPAAADPLDQADAVTKAPAAAAYDGKDSEKRDLVQRV